jgi:hypothetical protein
MRNLEVGYALACPRVDLIESQFRNDLVEGDIHRARRNAALSEKPVEPFGIALSCH